LKTFLEFSGKIYPNLVNVFFTNLQFKNDVLLSSVKGVQIEISKKAWKDVIGLRQIGVQMRKSEIGVVEEFNKVKYYGQYLRNLGAKIKVDERLLAMIFTKIRVSRGTNHSTLNEGDLILMYYIQNNVQIDWIFVLCDHMFKAKRLIHSRAIVSD